MRSLYVKELRICETFTDIYDSQVDLGNESKGNKTCIETYHNRFIEKPTNFRPLHSHNAYTNILSTFTIQTKHLNCHQSNAFNRSSRSRCITRHLVHAKRRDREPSRIPMRMLVNLISKNKKRRHKIKKLIRQLVPHSSSLHNLLSTRYRKDVSHKQTNVNVWQFRIPCRARKMQMFIKTQTVKISKR